MEYIQATGIHLDDIFNLIPDTIRSIYPRYYPKEVVDFFCAYHNKETIQADIDNGKVWVLFEDNVLVGTGSRKDNNITWVFVTPAFQGRGYGGIIMQKLEDEIGKEYHERFFAWYCCTRRHIGFPLSAHQHKEPGADRQMPQRSSCLGGW